MIQLTNAYACEVFKLGNIPSQLIILRFLPMNLLYRLLFFFIALVALASSRASHCIQVILVVFLFMVDCKKERVVLYMSRFR